MSRSSTRQLVRRFAVLSTLVLLAGLVATLAGTTTAQAGTRLKAVPIPTSGAAPGRIVTATDGTMWFVETTYDTAASKVGRITSSGRITEYTLSTEDYQAGVDLDASPDGTVWVLLEHQAVQLATDGSIRTRVTIPDYTTALRVDRNGIPWVVWTDPYGHLGRIVNGQLIRAANAPDCDDLAGDQLGIGSDGLPWCVSDYGGDGVTRGNTTGTAGQTFPLGDGRFGPVSLAAGPTGAVWFSHYRSYIRAPGANGIVGYVRADGSVRTFDTGADTAPNQLVRRPGTGQMWFVSLGPEPAIGHVNANGHGSIHTVGGYEPTALTFDHSGRIWFTDAEHNAVVRVSPQALSTTDIDAGEGSVLDPRPTIRTGRITRAHGSVHVKRHRFEVTLRCPRVAKRCQGRITAKTKGKVGGKHRTVAKVRHYRYRAGTKHRLKIRLTAKGRRIVDRHRTTRIKLRLYLPHHHKPSATRVVKMHR